VVVEPPSGSHQGRICYDFEGLPEVLLSTDRCLVATRVADTRTRLVNYEQFGGVLAQLVAWLKGPVIEQGFAGFNAALKVRAETISSDPTTA
jgi:hypothetical protein